jgi:CBS domain-containing protein
MAPNTKEMAMTTTLTMTTSGILARDVMTRDVLTVPPGMPVPALARLLADRHISGVPVLDSATGALLGLVSEGDLITQLSGAKDQPKGWLAGLFGNPEEMALRYAKTHGATAADIMTPAPVQTVTETTAVEDVAALMEQHHIRRVPVLRDTKVVGIVSRADLLRAVMSHPPEPIEGLSDQRIEQAIRARMRQEPWADTYWASVQVESGVATLYGFCRSDAVRAGLRVLAAQVDGVKRVEDKTEILPQTLYGHGWL